MPTNLNDQATLKAFEERIRTLLPEEYQDHYEDVQPVSMGSAILKYARDGKVAWDDIWETFCDLAMAGGPPHKGVLLQPGSPEEIAAQPDQYQGVVSEICRGVALVTELASRRAIAHSRMGAGEMREFHYGRLAGPRDCYGKYFRSEPRLPYRSSSRSRLPG